MIRRDQTIEEIFAENPAKAPLLAQALSAAGLGCSSCEAAAFETLEEGAASHGFESAQIDDLVEKLNALLHLEGPPSDTITLTPRAAEKYRSILAEEGKEGWGVRFEEKASGCSGFQYALDYSERAKESDETFISEGIEVHVPKALLDRLIGSQIDYVDGLQGAGFKITNPNVRTSCGCGSSHGY